VVINIAALKACALVTAEQFYSSVKFCKSGFIGESRNLNLDFLIGLPVNFKSSGFRKFIVQYQQVFQHTSNFISGVNDMATLKASSLVTTSLKIC